MLLPVLSSFIQKSSAPWFIAKISPHLSRIPLRADGVVQTIAFLATQFAPALGQDIDPSSTNPSITIQAIMQTSRLLSSVPQGMDAKDYFMNISPKLLALIDGDDPDLQKTASYVIGNGILGKRSYGAPGTVGYEIFMKPILDSLNGVPSETVNLCLRRFPREGFISEASLANSGEVLLHERHLLLALNRLCSLVLLYPNPSLLKRFVHPILLPLWGLQCYARENRKIWWQEKVFKLLQTFFSVSPGLARFHVLADHILYDGGTRWVYSPGQEGGVSIRKRDTMAHNTSNIDTMEILNSRVEAFLELLEFDPQCDELTSDIFLHVSRPWLLGLESRNYSGGELRTAEDAGDIQVTLTKLVNAKFTEKLLDRSRDVLSRRPLKLLVVVGQIIEGELNRRLERQQTHGNPSLRSLGAIVDVDESSSESYSPESIESITTTLSLLSSILTSPEFSPTEEMEMVLSNMKIHLNALLPYLPANISQPATTASVLIEITLSSPTPSIKNPEISPSNITDLQTHRRALDNLRSPLPPVQVEGLSLLSGLLSNSSPVVDIPHTLTLLLMLITETGSDSNSHDEYVYLNVIKLIGYIASKHPRTVIQTLTEQYADRKEENTPDKRLKIGEALLGTVQELGENLVGENSTVLGETMIAVSSRRGAKPKAKKAGDENAKKGKRRDSEDTVDPDTLSALEQLAGETESQTEESARDAFSAKILESWATGAESDSEPDDLRVRASAMSILASALKTNISGLGYSIALSSVDLALSTMTLETGPESAILRRAATVLLLDIVRALDDAKEKGVVLGFGLTVADTFTSFGAQQQYPYGKEGEIGNIPDILRVLRYVESKENDTIVRGHIQVLVEGLENWAQKSLVGGDDSVQQAGLGLGNQLAGLSIQPPSEGDDERKGRPRIEEIE